MGGITEAARKDYNSLIRDLADASEGIDTIVSVVKCGHGRASTVHREVVNSSVKALKSIDYYSADAGGTPLFDSVGDLIEQFEAMPDSRDPNVTFIIMATTDGQENASRKWTGRRLPDKMRELIATDRWTFTFRVPHGYKTTLVRLGIPEGNILEWDQNSRGVERATEVTRSAFKSYYQGVRSGNMRSTKTFYTDLSSVKPSEIKSVMDDITNQVKIWNIPQSLDQVQIRAFIEEQGIPYVKGTAFYQLMKREKEVQDYKKIVIKDRKAGKTYAGDAARDLLGLPRSGTVPVAPDDHGGYDIYVQSTSVNRKLPAGSRVLYWKDAI